MKEKKEKKSRITFGQFLLIVIDIGLLIWMVQSCQA